MYYGYTKKGNENPPKTLIYTTIDNILEEVERSLYNTLIQVPLQHFHQVYDSLVEHSNTLVTVDNTDFNEFTYHDITDLLTKVKSQIIGELR